MISNYFTLNTTNNLSINPSFNINKNIEYQNQHKEISINKNYQKKLSMENKKLHNIEKIKHFETRLDVKFIDYKLEKFKNLLDPDYIIKERYFFIPELEKDNYDNQNINSNNFEKYDMDEIVDNIVDAFDLENTNKNENQYEMEKLYKGNYIKPDFINNSSRNQLTNDFSEVISENNNNNKELSNKNKKNNLSNLKEYFDYKRNIKIINEKKILSQELNKTFQNNSNNKRLNENNINIDINILNHSFDEILNINNNKNVDNTKMIFNKTYNKILNKNIFIELINSNKSNNDIPNKINNDIVKNNVNIFEKQINFNSKNDVKKVEKKIYSKNNKNDNKNYLKKTNNSKISLNDLNKMNKNLKNNNNYILNNQNKDIINNGLKLNISNKKYYNHSNEIINMNIYKKEKLKRSNSNIINDIKSFPKKDIFKNSKNIFIENSNKNILINSSR